MPFFVLAFYFWKAHGFGPVKPLRKNFCCASSSALCLYTVHGWRSVKVPGKLFCHASFWLSVFGKSTVVGQLSLRASFHHTSVLPSIFLHLTVRARLRPGVPFFGASHPFRRPFLRSFSGGSHRPAHKNSRAFSSFLCTALAFFPRSCYTTHEVASFKPMLQVCICALLPMQPYTPHGDSNGSGGQGFLVPGVDATLYPARGQQHRD